MPFSLSSHGRQTFIPVSPLIGEVDLPAPAFLPTGKTDSLISFPFSPKARRDSFSHFSFLPELLIIFKRSHLLLLPTSWERPGPCMSHLKAKRKHLC